MAVLAQQKLHIATASDNRAVAIVQGRWQPGTTESPAVGGSVSYGGGCIGNLGRSVLPQSCSFHDLPLLQLHVTGSGLPVSKFVSSCSQVITKCRCIGNVGVNRQSPQRRASSGDDNGSSSEEETKDKDKETPEEQNDSKIEDEKQEADSQESRGEIGEGMSEDKADQNETSLQNEESKTGFWRKIWEPGQKDEDNTLGPEEELLLQDVETLTFDWRGLLNPTRENLLALGFTALLTLALLKILSQVVVVVITILLSAVKYTLLAVLLLGLLIFLL